jgi:phosphate transport system substrate-binding protein
MSKISSEWKKNVGTGKSVKWPTGLGAKGNEGVSGLIKQTKGSIGYCELAYTIQNDMPQAMLKNKAGNYVAPEIASISKAAAMDIPADTRVSITNTAAEQGYPVSGFTWVIVYKEQSYNNKSKEKAQSLVNLLWWMIHEGQQYCKPLDYAPLPQEAVSKAEALVKKIEYNGTELLKK